MSTMSLSEALQKRNTTREYADKIVTLSALQGLLQAAQGTTRADGKRTTPSAHALYPLRLFVAARQIDTLSPGLYSTDANDPCTLSLHSEGDIQRSLEKAAIGDQPWIGEAAGVITICADMIAPTTHFAEQPPYGERGLRYVYIEAGAAAQNIHLQATALGLACVLVAGFHDEATSAAMNLSAPLAPVLHMCIGWPNNSE